MAKPTALGANIFAGCFTLGVKEAGFNVLGHLEHGPYGVNTCRKNMPDLEIRVGRENWREAEYKNKVDFMYCNPPCAAWSNAAQRGGAGVKRRYGEEGKAEAEAKKAAKAKASAKAAPEGEEAEASKASLYRGGWETQLDRLRYVYDCVQAGIAIRPKAWCWESVTNAWRAGQQFVLQQAEAWNDAGYHVTVLLQDNQYLGAPQERKRMFLIAHKHPLAWPALTEPITVGEALRKAKKGKDPHGLTTLPMQPLYTRLWKLSENYSGYFRKAYEYEGRGGKEGRIPSVMTARLRLDRPGPVMTDPTHKLHPTEPRFLTWFEWLAMTGMPNDWIPGPRSIQQAGVELSRAVLRPVGRWLATAVLRGLKQPALRTPISTRLVDLTDPERPFEQELFRFEGLTIKPIVPPPLPPLNAPKAQRPPKPCEACEGDPKRAKRCKVCQGTGLRPRPPPRDPSKPGSGARIREMLMKGMDADSILAVIHKEFPGSRAGKSDVSWNRGKLRAQGQAVPGAPAGVGRPAGGSRAKGPAVLPPTAKAVQFGKAVA